MVYYTHGRQLNKMPNCDFRITVITSTYNCAEALTKTAESIRCQSYKNIQWIITDGASTDATLSVIKQNSDIVSHWVSEPDKGIYDAWNKACRHISGDWIIFIGAGDLFIDKDTVKRVAQSLVQLDPSTKIAYGDVYLINKDHKIIGRYGKLKQKWECNRLAVPAHQGVFQRADCFTCESPFDESYKIAADSKFLILHTVKAPPFYIGYAVALMDSEGISSSEEHQVKVRAEIQRINIETGVMPPFWHTMKVSFLVQSKNIFKRILPQNIFIFILNLKRRLFGMR